MRDNRATPPSMVVVDTRPEIEWVQVRIPNKAWMYFLREKKSDFHLKWIPVLKEEQCAPSVLCWEHRL
ncbi:hypothetical protein TNCV_1833241 [Trichonephila clavipes]|nr:hypothetical protein TNCV_1833241 [Trichonephila clavipes]